MMKKLVGAATVALAVIGWLGFDTFRDYFIGESLENAEVSSQIAVYQRFEDHSGVIGHVEAGQGVKLIYRTCEVPEEFPNNAYFITARINGVPVDLRWPPDGYSDTTFQKDHYCSEGWTGGFVFDAEVGDTIEIVWNFPVFVDDRLVGHHQVVMEYEINV